LVIIVSGKEKEEAWSFSNHSALYSNSASSKIAKSIITRLTNKQNMGGTRLIRGSSEVEKQRQSTKATTTKQPVPSSSPKPANGQDEKMATSLLSATTTSMDSDLSQQRSTTPTPHEVTEEEPSEQDEDDEIRKIDHLVFAVHG
jgi:hypothetical protein